jgi:Ig-like domain from next to BRCA1 gene
MGMHRRFALLIGMLSIIGAGCEIAIGLPQARGLPTSAPGMVETIVAATAGAAQTQTAALISPTPTSTWTPLPTHTPSLTPTLTPTFHFVVGATRTPTSIFTAVHPATATQGSSGSGSLEGCKLLSQTPKDGSHFNPKENFQASWKIENTGSSTWYADSVDFVYTDGTKMYKKQIVDLPLDIPEGESVTLAVGMVAPKSAGSYFTEWSLRRGQSYFCHVNVSINVP